LIFGFWGTLCISHEKYIKDGKILAHLASFGNFSWDMYRVTPNPNPNIKVDI
jgi:hypothetical protein